jgi:hypothetical protein
MLTRETQSLSDELLPRARGARKTSWHHTLTHLSPYVPLL